MSRRVKVEAWVEIWNGFWFADRRITQEMVDAVRRLSVHRYTYQGVPRERIDPDVAGAADILQALLDAARSDGGLGTDGVVSVVDDPDAGG